MKWLGRNNIVKVMQGKKQIIHQGVPEKKKLGTCIKGGGRVKLSSEMRDQGCWGQTGGSKRKRPLQTAEKKYVGLSLFAERKEGRRPKKNPKTPQTTAKRDGFATLEN